MSATSVIVADDENLEIARQHGFDTVEAPNDDLGRRFNLGFEYAAHAGADVFVHIGSDDWLHPDAFAHLSDVGAHYTPPFPEPGKAVVWRDGPAAVGFRQLTVVDLPSGELQRLETKRNYGCIPWFIPREAMTDSGFMPIPEEGHMRGIDGLLWRALSPRPNWTLVETPHEWLVDFKSANNVTPFDSLQRVLGYGDADSLDALRPFYPEHLVDRARDLSESLVAA